MKFLSFPQVPREVDNIEKTYAELQKMGVGFVGPPQQQTWETFLMMKDSEDNQIVLSSR